MMIKPRADRNLLSKSVTIGSSSQLRGHKAIKPSTLRVRPDGPDGKGRTPAPKNQLNIWKVLKLGSLGLAKSLGLFALARALTKRDVRILCYHGIWVGEDEFPGASMFMSRTRFAKRLEIIELLGMRVVSLADVVASFEGGAKLPDHCVVITIDDGWYSTFRDMLPLLRHHRMSATIYCDTASLLRGLPISHVMARHLRRLAPRVNETARLEATFAAATNLSLPATERLSAAKLLAGELNIDISPYLEKRVFDYMRPDELREAAEAGFDIQLHTHNHTLGDHSPTKVREEIDANRRSLIQLLGGEERRFCHFAYPSGEHCQSSAAALAQLGVRSSTTLEFGLASPRNSRQMLPRITDWEHMSELEFEAFLSGFMELVGPIYRALSSARNWLSRGVRSAL